jgi:hypothetical protein
MTANGTAKAEFCKRAGYFLLSRGKGPRKSLSFAANRANRVFDRETALNAHR